MATPDECSPKIVLIPHARSHPFAQRECVVNEPLKVGRPVDKKKITPNNFIFDCRVLSRNHALIWFDNGKFFIQDTKSSNGTFVNECRLSPSGEESAPVEMKSRDIIQFGVNVNVERKVTHGCIIGTVKLFINEKELPGPDPDIQQIMQIMQNALLREQELENKLVCMQEVITQSASIAKESMINIVKEDELLSRLEMLENQLQVYSPNTNEDELRKQLANLLEEKHKSNTVSKEHVRTLMQEKSECQTELTKKTREYDKAEEEAQRYKILYEAVKQEHTQQINKLTEQIKTLEEQKTEADDRNFERMEELRANRENTQVDLDFTRSELESVKAQLKEVQKELTHATMELEVARQKGFTKDTPLAVEVAMMDNELPLGSSQDTNLSSSIENGEMEATLTAGTANSISHGYSDNAIAAYLAEKKSLQRELRMSEDKILDLSDEVASITATRDSLGRKVNELESLLGLEMEAKSKLEDTIENQSQELSTIRVSLDETRREITDLREQLKNAQATKTEDLMDLPTDIEQCRAKITTLMRSSDQLQGHLQQREEELMNIVALKAAVEERLASVESEHTHLVEKNRHEKEHLESELEAAQTEAKSLKTQLKQLQSTLAVSKGHAPNTLLSHNPSAVIHQTPPDVRIKALSIITLASITVALVSIAISYIF